MVKRNTLPDKEFARRCQRVQAEVRKQKLDLVLAHSNESDFANVRYLSNYWPIFESAGVIIPAEGEPVLLIGPESETFAADRSRIKTICKLVEYRESAEPDYPNIKVDTFRSIFARMFQGKKIKRIGLEGYQIFPLPIYEALKSAAPEAEIAKSNIISDLRIIKSTLELEMLQESFRVSEQALLKILPRLKPEMTELDVVGLIEKELYAGGAEYEAHPQYVLSGRNSTHAIGRPGYRKLGRNNLVQLDIGGRIAGYSGSVGRPVCIGKMPPEMKRLVQAGLDLYWKTIDWVKAGVIAKEVTRKFFAYAEKLGVSKNALYGPCHGLGMIEVERPWMELHSNYPLRENMTFQVDTFLYGKAFGLRWENGIRVTAKGAEPFAGKMMKILEL